MSNFTTPQKFPSANVLIVFIVFKCLCFIVGILGNACVIIYNVYFNRSKTPTTYFVVNLAIIDFLACCVIYPNWITKFVRSILGVTDDQKLFCFVHNLSPISVLISILTLLAITVDKFVFINWPLRYDLIVTWRRTYFSLLVIWVFGIILIPLIILFTKTEPCAITEMFLPVSVFFVYQFIPFFIIVVLNYKIYKIAREQRMKIAVTSVGSNTVQSHNQSSFFKVLSSSRITRELKNIKTFAIIIGVLFCCILPYSIIVVVEDYWCHGSCIPVEVRYLFGDLVGVNSIVNPFIYGIRQKEYRNAFRRLWSEMCRRD